MAFRWGFQDNRIWITKEEPEKKIIRVTAKKLHNFPNELRHFIKVASSAAGVTVHQWIIQACVSAFLRQTHPECMCQACLESIPDCDCAMCEVLRELQSESNHIHILRQADPYPWALNKLHKP